MKKLAFAFLIVIGALLCVPLGPALGQDMTDYCSIPPFIARQGPPLVSIVLGRDHKLYYEAYNDASDLNNDGTLDVGYDDNIEYYGYFDTYTCYTYDGANARFNPSRITSNKYCGSSGEWSGNFLNWLSMSRADVLRKVLYGGHRSTDSSTDTVLEGIYIPQDAHSWGKEYSGSDTDQLTPFTDPTSSNRHLFCMTSIAENTPHRIRVTQNVSDRIWEWASTERAVCSGPETPAGYRHWYETVNDYMVRVKACVDSTEFTTTPSAEDYEAYLARGNCKYYTDGTNEVYKPIGILQKYGEGDGQTKVCSKTFASCGPSDPCGAGDGDCIDLVKIYFDLITGSYTKNKSGGVLRRVMGDISDEINPDTGQFNLTENTTKGNIILTLEELTTVNFDYSDFSYHNCGWITDGPMDEGECEMWGNPIGEMMYESLRYLADAGGATSDFDATPLAGLDLPTPSWDQPFQIYPLCSKPSMLVISDINPSFDSDQLPGTSFGSFSTDTDLPSLNVTGSFTDPSGINKEELTDLGITDVYIGQNGGTTDFICSSKSVSDMAQIRGLCAEEPTKEGSYYAAAVAHYGKTEFGDDTTYPNVTTYSVALASPIPDIKIQVGSNTVTLVPVGKSVSGGYDLYDGCVSQCSTVTYDANDGLTISGCPPPPYDDLTDTGSYCPSNTIVDFYVESLTSTSGIFRINFEDVEQGADHDMDAIVRYQYQVSGNTVTISLDSSQYAAGSIDQVLGFFISGTTEDGLYLPVKDDDVPDVADAETPAVIAGMPKTWSKVFTAGSTTAATLLKDPLWYAAKWGGFEDINGNDIPDLDEEWDRDADDVPDTYFLVHNPLELENQLNKAFGEILKRISAGTAVSVLSTSAGGEGSLYQAYFNPSVFDSGREVTWVGYLNALWVDQFGNLREDDGNQHLVLTKDPIIEFDLDGDGDTVVRKYSDTDGNGVADVLLGTYALTDLQPLWEGGEKLALRTTPARTIYTYIDADGDGVVDSGEFGNDKFDVDDKNTIYTYLNAADPDEAEKIIRYIRGEPVEEEDSNLRDRRLTVDGTANKVWKLGDIVYSTPTVVGRPSENYHLVYGDTTYLDFVRQHKNRQTVIFLGSNDGMLHAFSAGDYHEGDDSTTTDTERGWYDGDFGKELWAYIPYNLLPQLKWLMDPAYCHVYYVDLKAKVVDARIFSNGAPHYNGWGTVLVGAMRLGGKELTCNSRTFRSAYFAIDITDPANPNLLWESTSSDLNYSTSYPAVFRVGTVQPYEPDAQKGDWYVIFGSGPTTFEGDGAATSHVYICNLANGNIEKTFDLSEASGSDPSFMASPITVDLGLDYQVDVAYIASSYYDTSQSRWEGKIYRIDINEDTNSAAWTISPFVTLDKPITIAPVAALDPFNRLWLYWGTGRFFSNIDKIDTTVQRLYGVWDPGSGTIDASGVPSDLNNVTEIRVHELGYMDLDGDGSYDDTIFKEYLADKRAQYRAGTKYGWYLNMDNTIAVAGERVINSPTVLGNIVLFPSFKPEEDICDFGGSSYLYALYYETGTAYQESVIGLGTNYFDVGGNKFENLKRKYLGAGMPTSVVVHAGREEGVKGMIQLGTGVVEVVDITPADTPQSKTIFWREKEE